MCCTSIARSRDVVGKKYSWCGQYVVFTEICRCRSGGERMSMREDEHEWRGDEHEWRVDEHFGDEHEESG